MPTLRLTDRLIAQLKPGATQADYFDQTLPGFGVRVNPSGRKTFIVRIAINGHLRRTTLEDQSTGANTFPALALTRARVLARAVLQPATEGRDVTAERQADTRRTFGAFAVIYITNHAKPFKKSWADDERMIRRELAAWTDRPISAITRTDVRDLLRAIVTRGAPTNANRILALVRKMFNYALDQEWVTTNPAHRMPRLTPERARERVLSDDEIRTLWTALEQAPPRKVNAREFTRSQAVLKLRLLTAQRGGEILNMQWRDLEDTWWTIPGAVAKNGLAHRVFLTPTARALLDTLRPVKADPEGFVFKGIRNPSRRRPQLQTVKLRNFLPRDLRRTVATKMAAHGWAVEVVGKILNHVQPGVTSKFYARYSYDLEKQQALTWWDGALNAILTGEQPTVLPFVTGVERR